MESPGRRCDLGCESWPDEAIYARCPCCGEQTKRFSNLETLSSDEALALRNKLEFERYYAKYCALLGQTVDGPLAGDPVD